MRPLGSRHHEDFHTARRLAEGVDDYDIDSLIEALVLAIREERDRCVSIALAVEHEQAQDRLARENRLALGLDGSDDDDTRAAGAALVAGRIKRATW